MASMFSDLMPQRESESRVQFLVISVDFCQLRIKYHVIRASAETCYECLRGENKQKLEVLSFEKAWDKIEKDIFTWTVFCFVQVLQICTNSTFCTVLAASSV